MNNKHRATNKSEIFASVGEYSITSTWNPSVNACLWVAQEAQRRVLGDERWLEKQVVFQKKDWDQYRTGKTNGVS